MVIYCNCPSHLKHIPRVVLVSYPEGGMLGGKFYLEREVSGLETESKNGPKPARFLPWSIPDPVFGYPDFQVVGSSPKTLALVTACVLLWTPSLP